MKGETLKGHLDLLVLAVLAPGPLHGYAVIEALRERSGEAFDLPEGTVYPVLHRLAKAGLLQDEWSEATGRRRRTYRLTEQGRAALAQQRSQWQEFAEAISAVLKGASPWPSPI
jgi:PadR family transcriptional regulator, regulatory protein PadR